MQRKLPSGELNVVCLVQTSSNKLHLSNFSHLRECGCTTERKASTGIYASQYSAKRDGRMDPTIKLQHTEACRAQLYLRALSKNLLKAPNHHSE